MHDNTRLRRANDAVLTEMARSLIREDRPAQDASDGRSAVAQADRLRHTSQRFRRTPGGARLRPRVGTVSAPPA